ncbi:uncharacterized protein [Typha latifolia]|uniref:uncharacterized protein n=1 Tax=Typha latifolia TaxID=4733 RepID=UPI003C2EC441
MNEQMARRTACGLLFTRGGSILVFRENSDGTGNKNCNRVGCSTKVITGNSSISFSATDLEDSNKAQSSSRQGTPDYLVSDTSRYSTRESMGHDNRQRDRLNSKSVTMTAGKTVSPHSNEIEPGVHQGTCTKARQQKLSRNKEEPSISSCMDYASSRKRNGSGKHALPGLQDDSQKNGLKNPRDALILDVPRSGCPPECCNRKVSTSRKRTLDGKSSSSSSKSMPLLAGKSPHLRRTTKQTASRNVNTVRAHRDSSRKTRRSTSENIDDSLSLSKSYTQVMQPSSSGGSRRRVFHATMEDGDGYWHFSMEGTEEQLLETSSFTDDESPLDQHRELRLDIDDMSYEELLALGESIGSVNTGLSEEELSICLERSLYAPASVASGIIDGENADMKCSICQEEYFVGDELGKLVCKHSYHITCIHQWFQQKNWCPICKISASPAT